MIRAGITPLISTLAVLMSAVSAFATPIDQSTSALEGAPHVLLTFDEDGSGTPLPVNIGTDCFSPPFENCTFPADEFAALGVTFSPTTRIAEDNSACFRSLVSLGGSGPFGLVASNTDGFSFSPPVDAFEFWVAASASANMTVTTYDAADQTIETATFVGAPTSCGFPISIGYFGIVSNVPIHRVEFSSAFGILDQLRIVPSLTEVLDLTLTSECTDDPDVDRRWAVGNPNNFDVEVRWELSGTPQTDTITIPAGGSEFTTVTAPASDNTVTIYWDDENATEQSLALASAGVPCDDDNDGLPNKDEATFGTDPNDPDSDNDSLFDGEEVGLAAGSGCPDPLNADSDGDGAIDSVDNNICNAPPTADVVVEQLTNIGAFALVRLDGLGSSDDDPVSELTYVWTVDGDIVCDGDLATCSTIEVPLTYGDHEVTLLVTDTDGDSGSATTFVSLDPAQLSVLEIDFASIKFSTSKPRIKLIGEIGLPFGVDFSELNPLVTLGVDLADVSVVAPTDVTMTSLGFNERKWRFTSETGPVRSLRINWRGTRFHYREQGFPITIKSRMISSTESAIQVTYKRRHIGDGFVIDFGNGATLTVDENGDATSSVELDVDRPKRQVSLTLPFPLTDASVINISGFASRTINASQYLQASVGRYLLVAEFDPTLVPDGADNADPSIDLFMTVGDEAYFGGAGVGASGICSYGNRWISFGDD